VQSVTYQIMSRFTYSERRKR